MPLTTPPPPYTPPPPLAPIVAPQPPALLPPLTAREKLTHLGLVALGVGVGAAGLGAAALIGPALACASAGVALAGLGVGVVAILAGVLPLWTEYRTWQDSRAWHAAILEQYADFYATALDLAARHGEAFYRPPAPPKAEPPPPINKWTGARVTDVTPRPEAPGLPAWVLAFRRWRQSFLPALPAGAPTTSLAPTDAPEPWEPEPDPYTKDMRDVVTLALSAGGATLERSITYAHLTRPRWEKACDALTEAGIFAPAERRKARTFTPAWAALKTLPVDEAHARVSEQIGRSML